MDYKELEQSLKKLRHYESYFSKANELEYQYLSQMMITEYFYNMKTTRQIAELSGTKTLTWIHEFFKKNEIFLRPIGVKMNTISLDDLPDMIDKKLNLRDYESLKLKALELGYKTVNECIIDMYFNKHLTFKEIGEYFKQSNTWALYLIKKLNMQARNKKGGSHQKLTDKLKLKIINDLKTVEPTWQNCRDYLITNNIELSPKTIQVLYNFLSPLTNFLNTT
jgi:hypothetical protein